MNALWIAGLHRAGPTSTEADVLNLTRYPLDARDAHDAAANAALDAARLAGAWPTHYRQVRGIEAEAIDDVIGQLPGAMVPLGVTVFVAEVAPGEPIVDGYELDPDTLRRTGWWVCRHGCWHPKADRRRPRHRGSIPRRTRRP